MSAGEKKRKHVWGFWLAFGAGVLGINPYFLIFAFPLVLIGIGLVWAPEVNIRFKIMLSPLPFLPPIAFYSIVTSSY